MFENFIGKTISHVKIEEKICEGCSKIFVGTDERTKEKLVVDVKNNYSLQKNLEVEYKVGMNLSKNCLFLVKIREIVFQSDCMFIIMEYCPKGNLRSMISEQAHKGISFTDHNVLEMAFQLIKAVETLHIADIVHCDIKSDNIFVMEKKTGVLIIKLGDYGISKVMNSARADTTTIVGTLAYAPPEVHNGERFTKAGDVYSIGILFIELIDLLHPFCHREKGLHMLNMLTGKVNELREGLSDLQGALRMLALHMINLDFTKRPTITEVIASPLFLPSAQQVYVNPHPLVTLTYQDFINSPELLSAVRSHKNCEKILERMRNPSIWGCSAIIDRYIRAMSSGGEAEKKKSIVEMSWFYERAELFY